MDVKLDYEYIYFFFFSTCVMDCGFVIFSLPLFDFLLVYDFFFVALFMGVKWG